MKNDAHLFVTPEQIESEFASVVALIFDTYKDFNITDYRCVLSLRDPADKENITTMTLCGIWRRMHSERY